MLDEAGFQFVNKHDGATYRVCMWEGSPWLFLRSDPEGDWVPRRMLSESDVTTYRARADADSSWM